MSRKIRYILMITLVLVLCGIVAFIIVRIAKDRDNTENDVSSVTETLEEHAAKDTETLYHEEQSITPGSEVVPDKSENRIEVIVSTETESVSESDPGISTELPLDSDNSSNPELPEFEITDEADEAKVKEALEAETDTGEITIFDNGDIELPEFP